MRSVILCEGQDDLWFLAYYLNSKGWKICSAWKDFQPKPSRGQHTLNMCAGDDETLIWCVGGKNAFRKPISVVVKERVIGAVTHPVDSVIILRDRDDEDSLVILQNLQECLLPLSVTLVEGTTAVCNYTAIDESSRTVRLTVLIVPMDAEGAIETVLISTLAEKGEAGALITQEACAYIDGLRAQGAVTSTYLNKDRLVLKAKYSAVVSAINPTHSTADFQTMMSDFPWEQSEYVQRVFHCVLCAITTPGLLSTSL